MVTRRRLFFSIPYHVPPWGRSELFATLRCLVRGQVVSGPDRLRLEQRLGDYLELPHVLALNRGRCAIELALRALGVTESDEVVIPSFLCHSVLQSIRNTGAKAVFADLGSSFHVDPASIRSKLTARTKCVIVPHLFGEMAPIDAIEKDLYGMGIPLIDDAAQAFGARLGDRRAGTFGICGVISMGLGKPLAGAAGGALVTRDREFFERAKSFLNGEEDRVVVMRRALAGWLWYRCRRYLLPLKERSDQLFSKNEDSRIRPRAMSNLDAAIAIRQLEVLEGNAAVRHERAREFVAAFENSPRLNRSQLSRSSIALSLPLLTTDSAPPIERLIEDIQELGIEARRGYEPLHRRFELPSSEFQNTEILAERLVIFPLTGSLSRGQRRALTRMLSAESAPGS